MLVFVDESGDAGMKLGAGSSDYFVVTAVLFEDHDEAARCDERIKRVRMELGLGEHFEFHFAKCKNPVRKRFLEAVAAQDFFYLAVAVDKAKLRNPAFQKKEALIKYAAGLVFENAKPYLHEATVVIDASGSKDFRNQLSQYLKKRARNSNGRSLIKTIRTSRSRGDNLVQLADMVSGAVWRSLTRDDASFRQLVSSRELKVQLWPGASA
jgi:hypothetical protein